MDEVEELTKDICCAEKRRISRIAVIPEDSIILVKEDADKFKEIARDLISSGYTKKKLMEMDEEEVTRCWNEYIDDNEGATHSDCIKAICTEFGVKRHPEELLDKIVDKVRES